MKTTLVANLRKEVKDLQTENRDLNRQNRRLLEEHEEEIRVNHRLSSELGRTKLQVEYLEKKLADAKETQEKTDRVLQAAIRFKVIENLIDPLDKRLTQVEQSLCQLLKPKADK